MKKSYALCFLLGFILALFSGCKKENLNFDRLNSADISGEWGIPLLNAQYSINDVLAQLEDNGIISQEPNGDLYFQYELEEENIITSEKFLHIEDIHIQEDYQMRNALPPGLNFSAETTKSFSFENPYLSLKQGEVKSGTISIRISHNLDVTDYNLVISSADIFNANGQEFNLTINRQDYQNVIDLSRYSFNLTEENAVALTATLSFTTGIIPEDEYSINVEVDFLGIDMRSVTGKIAPYTVEIDESADISLLTGNNTLGGNVVIYDPQISLTTNNTFPLTAECRLDRAEFSGPGGSTPILRQYPTIININQGEQTRPVDGPEQLILSPDFNKINVQGTTTLNPNGQSGQWIRIDENSSFGFILKIKIPFRIKIENVYYRDTIAFNPKDLVKPELIDKASFRFTFANKIPVNLSCQAYFRNTGQNNTLDTLFRPALTLIKDQENSHIVEIDHARIDNLFESDQIILEFKLNTGNGVVSLNAHNYLKAILGLKFSYNATGIEFSDLKN